ncbi:MAG: sodium:solute symporter family protein [Acidobacteria bacterium]|nr:sodium:solute symporter family protein [Acidobacteriota bacterium]
MSASGFGITGLAVVVLYLAAMVYVGLLARRARVSNSLGDFYLAGRTLGPFVLFATLYATQYSGNSFLGYPGEAYRIGFAWVMSVGFMTAIIVAYLLFAPRLYRESRRLPLITPGDWLDHRFGSPALTLAANLVLVAAIANYLLAQLMAMGHVVAGLSGGSLPYWVGVVGLTAVILIYETLGGMRAVAWTDAVQGVLIIVGLGGILAAVVPSPGHLAAITEWVAATAPEKAAVPPWSVCVTWASTLVLIGVSGAVYPQAIQRIYAARSARALKRGVAAMACMPLATMVPLFLVGIISLRELSALEGIAADQVMPLLLARWAAASPWLYAASLAVMLAVVAAIMSTADSVLLTLSSIIAKDFIGKTVLKGAPDTRLTRAGKVCSWAVVGVLVAVALVPRITLWGLIELKMEILIQVAPLFMLGIHWRRLTAQAALAGLLSGIAVSFALPAAGYARPLGVHDGLIGALANLLVSVAWSQATVVREGTAVSEAPA